MYRSAARPELLRAAGRTPASFRFAGTSSSQHPDALKQRRQTTIDSTPTTSPGPLVPRTPHVHPPATPVTNLTAASTGAPLSQPHLQQIPQTAKELKAGMARTVGEAAGGNSQADSKSQLAQLENLMAMSQMYPHADVWGQKMGTLNVVIPETVPKGASLSKRVQVYQKNFSNWTANVVAMYRLAESNSFPSVSLARRDRWSRELFRTTSTNNDAWVAGIRRRALDTYEAVNLSIADGDHKSLKKLATATYLDHATKLARQYDRPDRVYRWKMLDVNAPVQVLSLRAMDGYLGTSEPKIGSRLIVHALVKFDTQQSFETLAKKGGARIFQTSKRVVEYLVFERRMWYDGLWVIREQLFE